LWTSFALVAACILGSALVMASCSAMISNLGKVESDFRKGFEVGFKKHRHTPLASGPKVLDLTLDGVISFSSSSASLFSDAENSSLAVLNTVHGAVDDDSVRGIFLRVNSGGGEITASDILWNQIRAFKEADTNRLVVVLMGSLAASGAYYVACAADTIIAHPTTMTGSIGVKIESVNIKGLADKLGVKSATIASGENKDFLNPLKDLTPAQEAMLQKMVDSLQDRFVSIVAEGRNLAEAEVRAIADGRVLLAQEALDAGLIDEIGYEDDAKDLFREHFGETPDFVTKEPGFWEFLRSPGFYGEVLSSAAKASLDAPAASRQQPVFSR
jgi:protease-4